MRGPCRGTKEIIADDDLVASKDAAGDGTDKTNRLDALPLRKPGLRRPTSQSRPYLTTFKLGRFGLSGVVGSGGSPSPSSAKAIPWPFSRA